MRLVGTTLAVMLIAVQAGAADTAVAERGHGFYRATLDRFPALQPKLVSASIANGATFDCSGDNMWRYRVPGAGDLPVAK